MLLVKANFVTIDLALAKYIQLLWEKSNQTFFNFVVSLLVGLWECLNQYGYDLLTKMQQTNPELEITFNIPLSKENFCSQEKPENLPLFFNFFTKKFLIQFYGDEFIDQFFIIEFLVHFS